MAAARKYRDPIHREETGVASADRTLSVLSAFRGGDVSLTLAELARRTGLYKSTILRLAVSLERRGYLTRAVDGNFSLGGEIARLAEIHIEAHDLPRTVHPALKFLARETEETASFWVPNDGRRLCLMRVKSPLDLRIEIQTGVQRAMDGSSASQVLMLAPPSDTEQKAAVSAIYTSNVGTPHVASLSAPVFGIGGVVVGSLTLSGPESRLHRGRARDLEPLLVEVSRDLTRKLGGRKSPAK